jgi:hypothetical protein
LVFFTRRRSGNERTKLSVAKILFENVKLENDGLFMNEGKEKKRRNDICCGYSVGKKIPK